MQRACELPTPGRPPEGAALGVNVRWDAVVPKRAFGFAGRAPEVAAAAAAPGPLEVRVKLFGMPVAAPVPHPIVLRFEGGCALRDVIDELGRRLGPQFLRGVLKQNGESFNTCRLFLNGEPVQELATAIPGGPTGASVEIILFREIEGG